MKGQVGDIFVILIILVVVIFSSILAFYILSKFDTAMKDVWSDQNVSQDVIDKGGEAFGVLDKSMLILVGGLFAGLVISGFYVRTHPAYFVMFLLGFAMLLLVTPTISNLLVAFEETETISDEINMTEKFPFTQYVSRNLPLIAALSGILFMIILFGKPIIDRYGGVS